MKILVISQRYYPENFLISDIAETLVSKGHDVTVLTGLPMYPRGYIFDEYKKDKHYKQEHNGVKIIRVKEIQRRNNIFSRVLNYYSFPIRANRVINKLDKDFDVILVNELSPIFSCLPAIKYKKKYGTKIVMYEMDLWPESLLAGGIKKDSLIYNHYKKVSAKIYSSCDKILVSTKEHIEYIHCLPNCEKLDIKCLPQYAEKEFENIPNNIKSDNKVNFMFAGNIGKAQNLDLLIRTINVLKNNKDIVFHIVGDGSEKTRLERLAKKLELNNVIFYENKPKIDMPKFYSIADVMIVSLQDSPYANMTIPCKVASYMASGKAILCACKGATYNLIKEANCGIAIDSLDSKHFAEACLSLLDMNIREKYSIQAKQYYKNHFDKEVFFNALISEFK